MTEQYPWDGMFQTKAEIDAYLSGDRITCLLCGKPFLVLASHIKAAHNVSVDEYKQRYGIPWKHGLVCATTHKKYSDLTKQKRATGIMPQQPSQEHITRLHRFPPEQKRPIVPATRHAMSQQALRTNGYTEKWQPSDYDEYLRRLGTGRTILEVGKDPDMPANYLFYKYYHAHPEFCQRFEEVWDSVPFHVQIRGQHTGHRFKETLVMFREVLRYTWPQVADAMEVKESTVRTAYHYLKHSGKLEEYRARVQRKLQTQGLL
jgi:predicted transcriptional regulator